MPRVQPVAALFGPHDVRRSPHFAAPVTTRVNSRRPITGVRTVLPVLAESTDARGRTWLRVRLPGRTLTQRPPGTGWISAAHTHRSNTAWHIVADTRAHRVAVYHYGRRVHRYPAVVGKPSTPTPRGEFFVEEGVRLAPGAPGAPFALATNARSRVLQEFEGGPGQIALHGLRNLAGVPGTAVSHGCVRLGDADIAWLAAHIGPGVPVTIT